MRRRDVLSAAVAAAGVLMLPGAAWAGAHYAFVKFEANGAVVTGNTDITNIGGETLDRGEWIQCKRVTYGLKRDIGTGARVSGHTHHDRLEFDMPQGPARAIQAGAQGTLTIRFFDNPRGAGEPVLVVRAKAKVARKSATGETTKLIVDLTEKVAPAVATRAKSLAATVGAKAEAPVRAR